MADRTHLTQPDEALRQVAAQTLHNLVGVAATLIADYLTETRPADNFIEASRRYLAARYAKERAHDRAREDEVNEALLRLLPSPRLTETRGEYALRLRAILGRTHV
ncbi:hypothetical protein [Streptomyces hydrogenans]|uniref:hypothetical protein n=1 Tax=Streptomyces hydrogenans TaxID=1873719 RepID=UPI0037F5CC0E